MPREFPSKKIDIIGKPDATPEFDFLNFVESCNATKLYNFIKMPVWDSVGDSLEDCYLSARIEHAAMVQQKNSLIEHQRLQNLVIKSQFKHLYQDQAKLRNRFVSVNILLRDFKDKQKSAVKMAFDEFRKQIELQASNDKIHCYLNELFDFFKEIKATADEYEPYETLLEDVVEQSPDFKSIKELMDRCDSLMLGQVEISELTQETIINLEIMRKELVDVANEAALHILGLKNALSSIDQLYETARNECHKWEKTLSRVKLTINEAIFNRDRGLDSINHMYRLLCKRRSIQPELAHSNAEERLDFIKNEVEILQEVLNETQETTSEVAKINIVC